EAGPGPTGSVITVDFLLEGQEFVALNGGPEFTFTPAISFIVNCETQDEVDGLWETLSLGGTQGRVRLAGGQVRRLVADRPDGPRRAAHRPDPERTQRVMRAMLEMRKLDIAGLERAAEVAPRQLAIVITNLPRERSSPTRRSACGSSSNVNVRVIGTLSEPSPAICTTRANASGSVWPITFAATTPRWASASTSG